MTDITKRLNFFEGFFTTAKDWNDGQNYHLEKRRLHNRRLHTPGVIRGEGEELRVKATDPAGLSVKVLPGAAMDSAGNEICLLQPRTLTINPSDYTLPQLIYIAIKYEDEPSDYVENVENSDYNGHTRIAEIPHLELTSVKPNNQNELELARIDLQTGVTEVTNPGDPDNPSGNQIDRCYITWAGSVGVAEYRISLAISEKLIQIMGRTRRDFAALERRFPVPSEKDVRHAALTVEMLIRIGSLRLEVLPGVLAAIAAIEQDVGQEIGATYTPVIMRPEFQAYQDAVSALLNALRQGEDIDILLTRQDQLAEAARELSELVIQLPVAEAGTNQIVITDGVTATVALDASASEVFGGSEITAYHWRLVASQIQPPVAEAGADRTVFTSGDEAALELDATSSTAFGGRDIVQYRWDKKKD